jgi:hypothetical protein
LLCKLLPLLARIASLKVECKLTNWLNDQDINCCLYRANIRPLSVDHARTIIKGAKVWDSTRGAPTVIPVRNKGLEEDPANIEFAVLAGKFLENKTEYLFQLI